MRISYTHLKNGSLVATHSLLQCGIGSAYGLLKEVYSSIAYQVKGPPSRVAFVFLLNVTSRQQRYYRPTQRSDSSAAGRDRPALNEAAAHVFKLSLRLNLKIHAAAHAAHAAAGAAHAAVLLLLRDVGDDRLGGQQHARD
jgi:hypothetical protein